MVIAPESKLSSQCYESAKEQHKEASSRISPLQDILHLLPFLAGYVLGLSTADCECCTGSWLGLWFMFLEADSRKL